MNSEYEQYKMDGLHEECGVFGMYDLDGGDVASSIYYGLFSLQHRGQESCGIAVSDTNGPKRKVDVQKGMGLVNEVFRALFDSRRKQQPECAAACAELCQRYAHACSQWKSGQCT